MHEQVVCELDAVPAAVTVHRVVATDHGADPSVAGSGHPPFDRVEEARARVRERVATVGERVHDEVWHVSVACELDQREQVPERRVHPAVGHQAEQVHALGARERGAQDLVLGQATVGDRVVDADQILAHHAARAEVQVTHLGVAHLPVGQSHRSPAGREDRVREALPQLVEHRRARERHRVAGTRLGQAPSVEHDQTDAPGGQAARSGGDPPTGGAHRAVAPTICANESACRDAPPTSAPSTSASASSSAALSGFTEPP